MRTRTFAFAAVFVLMGCAAAHAALTGQFQLVNTDHSTNAIVYPGPFDTWAFTATNKDAANVTAFEFHFAGPAGTFIQTASTSFQQTPTNPIAFGFEAPDTFFVTRPTIPNGDVLIAPGTLVDTTSNFDAAYAVAGGPSLLDVGETRAVAFFSVPSGTQLGAGNFVSASAAVGGVLKPLTYGPPDLTPPTITPLSKVIPNIFGSPNNVITNLQLQASDNVSTPAQLVWSNFQHAGPLVGTNLPTLSSSGVFNWPQHFAMWGLHQFSATVTDLSGNSTTDVALNVNVLQGPEPSSITLGLLAVAGLAVYIRRR